MPKSQPNENLRVSLEVNVHANGSRFQLAGVSNGIPGSGNISASVQTKDKIPTGFHLPLLSYVLITGQPIMNLARKERAILFKPLKGYIEQ